MGSKSGRTSKYPWADDLYRIYSKRRRHSRAIRISAALAAVILCYIVFANSPVLGRTTSPQIGPQPQNTGNRLASHRKARPAHPGLSPQAPISDEFLAEDAPKSLFKDEDVRYFEAGLKHIFAIAPDEIHVRELLRPIDGTGKERLRETGVRARAFRTLFEPWEALHVVTNDNGTFVRDDVVTYLRQASDLSGISDIRSRAEIIRAYENYRYFLTKLSSLLFPWTAPYFADHMTLHAHLRHGQRGIVLSGGDGQLGYLMTSAKSIRKLGCTMPIEVMYLGDDDLGDDSRAELESIPDVITRDMKQMVTDKGWDIKGWAGKPFAILLSSFKEVLFIDADAMFFHNPELLFEDPDYVETGALFFRDRLMFPEMRRKWLQQILPKPVSSRVRQSRFWTGESGHMQESGVVVVDKWRHFMALLMVTRMNGPDRDGNKDKGTIGIYDMVYGDKETFWIGWELVGDHDYAFHPGDAGNMGVAYADRGDSPKISDTAAMIGKHAELGSLTGNYETTIRSRRKGRHRSKAEVNPKAKKRPAPEPAADAETATSGDKDFKIFQDEEIDDHYDDDESIADTPRLREYEEENRYDMELDIDEDENDYDTVDVVRAPRRKRDSEEEQLDSSGDAPKLRKRSTEDAPEPELPRRLSKRSPAPRKAEKAKSKTAVLDSAEVDDEDMTELPKPKGQPMLEESDVEANYTICAPQLLHLGRDGRPLWFNGWILDNKFDRKHASPSKFSVWMAEKREDKSTANWMLQKNNMCCLQSDKIHRFTVQEKESLKMIVDIARDVGAFGRKQFGDD